jgi:hypothetical protein
MALCLYYFEQNYIPMHSHESERMNGICIIASPDMITLQTCTLPSSEHIKWKICLLCYPILTRHLTITQTPATLNFV